MNMQTNKSGEQKVSVKIGVQTMMWGYSLTTRRLKQVIEEIASTAKSVFHDIKEVGIEFGQKIHHLCYDISGEEIYKVENGELREFLTDNEFDKLKKGELDEERVYLLKKDVCRAERLAEILLDKKFNGTTLPRLTLLGFSGRGSLKKRIDFCRILNEIAKKRFNGDLTPKYFLFYEWSRDGSYKKRAKEAAELGGVPLAFHPLRYGPADKLKQINQKLFDIDKEMKELPNNVPQVKFVPDTAHLWLANKMTLLCDPGALEWIFEDKLNRITAFHLKDWKKTFDSSLRYYSRGFTALGGVGGYLSSYADGKRVEDQQDSDLGKLCKRFYVNPRIETGRWVVFEQDFTVDNTKDTLHQSLEWFRKIHDNVPILLPASENENTCEILPATLLFNEHVPEVAQDMKSKKFDARKRQIINALHYLASDNSIQFGTILQDLCRYLFYGDRTPEHTIASEDAEKRPVHVAIWEISPRISTMVLLNKKENIWKCKFVDHLSPKPSYEIENDTCTGFRIWKLSDLGELSDSWEKYDERWGFFQAYTATPEQLKERLSNLTKEEKKTSCDTVLWIPICNTYNYNQIEARLDIFVNNSELPILTEVQIVEGGTEKVVSFRFGQPGYQDKLEEYLDDLVQNIGSAMEKMWGNAAYQTTSELIDQVEDAQTSEVMLKKLIDTLTSHFKLKQGGGIYYELSKEENLLRKCAPWSSEEDKIADEFDECKIDDPGYQSYVDKDFWVGKDSKGRSWMAFPIFDSTSREDNKEHFPEVFGIIRCCRADGKSFTASDENTAREILADFVPPFLIHYISEHRMKSISFIRHELKCPLVAIKAAIKNIIKEVNDHKLIFSGNRDYGKDIKRHTDIMSSVLDNSVFLGKEVTMDFDNERIPLIGDIVMPAINQGLYVQCSGDKNYLDNQDDKEDEMAAEIRRKISVFCNGYKRNDYIHDSVRVEEWKDILRHGPPSLYIDGARMLQVFFNLLVNAIKYRPQLSDGGINIYLNRLPYGENPFYLNRGSMGPKGYMPDYDQSKWAVEILFCDEGLGIPNNCNELIFKEGFRASNVKNAPKQGGDGLGLWVVRKILKLHKNSEISLIWNGGEFTPGYPTMFRILLAKSLTEPHT